METSCSASVKPLNYVVGTMCSRGVLWRRWVPPPPAQNPWLNTHPGWLSPRVLDVNTTRCTGHRCAEPPTILPRCMPINSPSRWHFCSTMQFFFVPGEEGGRGITCATTHSLCSYVQSFLVRHTPQLVFSPFLPRVHGDAKCGDRLLGCWTLIKRKRNHHREPTACSPRFKSYIRIP
jgi:hypothetical protein